MPGFLLRRALRRRRGTSPARTPTAVEALVLDATLALVLSAIAVVPLMLGARRAWPANGCTGHDPLAPLVPASLLGRVDVDLALAGSLWLACALAVLGALRVARARDADEAMP